MDETNLPLNLLKQSNSILEIKRKTPPKPGENFNIFSILNVETNEVKHCRFIYEFLNPNGSHGMGDLFLRAFFDIVLKKAYRENVSVYREFVIPGQIQDQSGRTDLMLGGPDFCYIVEVKIYAGDQWQQIYRYNQYAANKKEHMIYYLTLDGKEPSDDSKQNINENDYKCVSFSGEIRDWMIKCGEIAWKTPTLVNIIEQYIKLIDKLTGNWQEDIYMEQIAQIIGNSSENIEAAIEIENACKIVQAKKMCEVFDSIEKHMDGKLNPLKPHEDLYDDAFSYYLGNQKYFGGMSYRLTEHCGYTLTLSFEINHKLYFGVWINKDGQCIPYSKDMECIADAFTNEKWHEAIENTKPGQWSIWWEYLPINNPIDFKKANRAYLDLYDPEKYQKIMDEIYNEIDAHFDNIKNTGMY